MLEILGFITVIGLIYHWLTSKVQKPVDDALSQAQVQAFENILKTANDDPNSMAAEMLKQMLKENNNDQT